MSTKIELLKTRDFGELISDTFVFIRQNFKPLVGAFFLFCGFFLVAAAVAGAMQQVKVLNVVNSSLNDYSDSGANVFSRYSYFRNFGIEYFLSLLFVILSYTTMNVTVFSYMALYKIKGNEAPSMQEVWGYIKYFFLRILGSGILVGLILIVGCVLCLVPGIYLYPILVLVIPIIIIENSSLGYAFSKSFRLIKDNWWLTFGALFVIVIIVYFANMIILVPLTMVNISSVFLHRANGIHFNVTITIITTVLQHVCQVFYIIPMVTIGLCYFNLNEKVDATGLMERINKIGTDDPEANLPTGEY